MQTLELPTLEVASFVTSDARQTVSEDTSLFFPWCDSGDWVCDSDLDCTQTVCSTSDRQGGNSCSNECHPGSSGC
jgi:hypothetical protein